MSIITTTGKLEGVCSDLATMEACRMTLARARADIEDDDAWEANVDAENALIHQIADHTPTCIADAAFQLRLAEVLIKLEPAVWEPHTHATVRRVAAFLEADFSGKPVAHDVVDPHMAWEAERQDLWRQYNEACEAVTDDMTLEDEDKLIGPSSNAMRAIMEKIRTTPARTIEGAIVQIEAIDRVEVECEPGCADDDMHARAMAIDTIRRCAGTSASSIAPAPQTVSPHLARLIESYHVTLATWLETDEDAAEATQLFANYHKLAEMIAKTLVHSRADAAAKLELAAHYTDMTPEAAQEFQRPVVDAIKEAIAWLER
ncbi:MAG: hypothetical protein AAF543_06280 [Pseudomonadota bacterium]